MKFIRELHSFANCVKITVSENDPEDMKFTTMDPNTRSLIKVNISDIQNDTEIFNILRSNSPQYAAIRKSLMYSFTPDKSLIDT